MERLSKFVRD